VTVPFRRPLWRRSDAVGLVLAEFVAVVLLVVAWWGTSRAVEANRQDGWFGLGMAGLVVAGVGNGIWLLAGRTAVSRRTRAVASGAAVGNVATRVGRLVDAHTPQQLVGGASLAHYHWSDCRLAAGRPVESADRDSHERLGRRPCGVCRP
jgi:hypothetical protein